MFKDLDELIKYLKKTLPQPKAILHLKAQPVGGYVTFQWNSRTFLVRQNLQVLEVRNSKVFVTGASSLMQSVLVMRNHHQKKIEGIVGDLREAEGMITGSLGKDKGLQLLGRVKSTLGRLAGEALKRCPVPSAAGDGL